MMFGALSTTNKKTGESLREQLHKSGFLWTGMRRKYEIRFISGRLSPVHALQLLFIRIEQIESKLEYKPHNEILILYEIRALGLRDM
jgi:hypothetical protein